MEFTASTKRFKEAFGLVGRLVPTKAARPLLQSVKVTAYLDALSFEVVGDGVSIRHRLANAGGFQPIAVQHSGVALFPRADVDSILSVAGSELIQFGHVGDKIHVQAGKAKWTLPTESPDAYPAVPDFDCTSYHTLAVADMKRLVKRTLHAVDAESVQYALGGMLAESSGPDLAFVATDGSVLSRQSVPATLTGSVWDGESQRVIPASTLNTLVAMLSDGGSDVSVGFPDDQSVRFRFGDTVFSGQLLNGRFPPWRKAESRILPESTRSVRVACEALRAATEQASVLSSSETRRVMYAFSEGACRLAASDAGSGVSDVEFPLPWEGDPLSIDLDPTYLVPMLKSIAGDVEVECRTTPMDNPNAAFVVATDDGFLGWVMAMSREAAR